MSKLHYTISVLVPTYQRPIKLKKCLECLYLQVRAPDEVVVMVRPEDQASIEVIELLKGKMPFLKMIYTYDAGVVAAENAGLKEISNDLVAFIDDDGYAPPEWLLKIEAFFLQHPEASAVGGPDIIVRDPMSYHNSPVNKVGVISWYGRIYGNHHKKSSGDLRRVQVLKGVNMTCTRKELCFLDEKLAGKDGNLGNGSQWELDLCFSILNKKGAIYFMPDLIVNHDSDHSTHNFAEAAKNNAHNYCYVMLKHLTLPRKIIFLLYATLIGNTQLPGLLRGVFDLITKPSQETYKILVAKIIGFYFGIHTYLTSLKRDT